MPAPVAVVVFKQSTPQPGFNSDFSVAFGSAADGGVSSCTQKTGACCFLAAPFNLSLDGTGFSVAQDYGPIEIRNATNTFRIGTLVLQPFVGYTAINNSAGIDPDAGWTAGDRMFASALGGDGGSAFDGGIKTVALISGLVPPISFAGGHPVPRANPFQVSWTPDPAAHADETVFVRLVNQNSGDTVLCIAPDATGTVTVPASLLTNFPVGSMGTFLVARHASVRANGTGSPIAIRSTTEVLGYLNFQ